MAIRIGTRDGDTLEATVGADVLFGRARTDWLRGLAAKDELYGAEGTATLEGDDGSNLQDQHGTVSTAANGAASNRCFGQRGSRMNKADNRFTLHFVAQPEHIDARGHVNNAVWVRWMEEIAAAHWMADALPEHVDAFVWLVIRHEIDFRGNVGEGEIVEAVTEIREPPRGARSDRYVTFRDAGGKELVRAKTTWAMIDRITGRLARVTAEVAAPFLQDHCADACAMGRGSQPSASAIVD